MSNVEFTQGECPHCAVPYRLPLDATGRRARCRSCGEVFRVGAEPPPPAAESNIIRHVAREREWAPAFGDGDSIDAISEHIARHIGPVDRVFHELVSHIVHIDVHLVGPTPGRPCHTLVTSGMSDQPMAAPEGASDCRHAELMISLPRHWKLAQADFEDESWYWPLRWLKRLARLPHEYDTWLWEHHTVPNSDPPEPFAPNTKLCGMMLVRPPAALDALHALWIGDRCVRFFALLPLYAEEMTHKLAHGAESLMARLQRAAIPDVVDLERKNVCKKRLGLW